MLKRRLFVFTTDQSDTEGNYKAYNDILQI